MDGRWGWLGWWVDRIGVTFPWEELLQVAAKESSKMEAAFRAVAIENEPNPEKVRWNC